jgi:hypothetical protein
VSCQANSSSPQANATEVSASASTAASNKIRLSAARNLTACGSP